MRRTIQVLFGETPVRVGALMSVAPYFRLDAKRARGREEGHDLGMSAVELDQFADAFEHEERDVARKLGAR